MRKVYNLIGIAQHGGKVSSGNMAAQKSLLGAKACLLIVSEDISANSRDELLKISERQKIPWIMLGNKYELGNSIGKPYRVALTVNEPGLAQAIIRAVRSVYIEAKTTGVVEWPK